MRVIGMAFLCVRQCASLRPCWPPVPPTSRALSPLRVLPRCLSAFPVVFCFCVPVVALSAAPTRPACAPCSSPCYACLAAPCPLTRPSPLPFTVSQLILPALFVCPLCRSRAVSDACHLLALPLPLPVAPTLFPGGSPTLVLFPRPLSLTSSGKPCALRGGGGGGVYLWTGLRLRPKTCITLAVGFIRTRSHRIFRRYTTSLPTSLRCICTVDQRRLAAEISCGDSVRSYSNRIRARRRGLVPVWSRRVDTSLHNFAGCSMESMATKGMAHSGSAEAKPSEQGTRKSNGINAAPSCSKLRRHAACQWIAHTLHLSDGKNNSTWAPPRRGPAAPDLRTPVLPPALPSNLSENAF